MGVVIVVSIFVCFSMTAIATSLSYVPILPKVIFKSNPQVKNGNVPSKQITVVYFYNNQNVILDLTLSNVLVPKDHFMSYQQHNGDETTISFNMTNNDLCHFHVSCE